MAALGSGRDWRQVGETVAELRRGSGWGGTGYTVSAATTIEKITKTQIITADDTRYNREGLWPIAAGRYGRRELVSIHDPRVVIWRAKTRIRALAEQAANLDKIERKTPAEVLDDAAVLRRAAADLYVDVARMLGDADRAARESDR
jgi:hypothetical protein